MTLVDVNPTILEDYKICLHVDHGENISYNSYIVEFENDLTCNYFERGKHGYTNFHITHISLVMLKLFFSIPICIC